MKRNIIVILVALVGAASCYAPIHDKPAGQNYHGELSQEQLSKLQGSGVTNETPEAVSVPDVDSSSPSRSGKDSDLASKILSGNAPASAAAQQSLALASKDAAHAKAADKPGFGLMMGGLFVLAGLGVAYGLRSYMDKVVPERNTRRLK